MKEFFSLRDVAVAFSLANVWFVTVWKQLLYINDDSGFFKEKIRFEYAAVAADILLLAFIFFVLLKLSAAVSNVWLKRAFQLPFLILALCAFGGLSSEIVKWCAPKTIKFVNIALPFFILCLSVVFSVKHRFAFDAIVSNLKLAALFIFPFCLVVCFRLFTTLYSPPVNPELPSSIAKDTFVNQNVRLPKVVWMIFDEMDYAILTTAKKRNIDVTDIERLMNESFVAENALPPSNGTSRSIPSLLTGKLITNVKHIPPDNVIFTPINSSEELNLRETDTIVSDLNRLGANIAVGGWAYPYPRIFKEQVSYSFWRPMTYSRCAQLIPCAIDIYRISFLNVPFGARLSPSLWNNADEQLERNKFFTDRANELIAKPELNFSFFHFSIPHLPYINRQNLRGEKRYFNSVEEIPTAYFEALEVVNDTLKRLRETLETSGQWNDTVFIVSSDHWFRSKTLNLFDYLPEEQRQNAVNDLRIPFIVKFAGQKTRVDYEPSFNTVVTRKLILSIFNGTVKNPDDFILMLDSLRATEPELINFRPPTIQADAVNN